MIRVNLLIDARQTSSVGTTGGVYSVTSTRVGTMVGQLSNKRDLLIRLGMVLIPIVIMFGYREYLNHSAKGELASLQEKLVSLKTQLQKLDPQVKETERFQDEKKKVLSQLEIVKKLSKERIKNVKSLDALQSLIPPKSWLTSVKIIDNKVEIEGLATDDIILSDFMQALGNSIYFSNVSLVTSDEIKTNEGVAKKFSLRCNLEHL